MATHSSTLAWRIPWTEEPGGLQSTGSQRVGHARGTWDTERECAVCHTPHPSQSAASVWVITAGHSDLWGNSLSSRGAWEVALRLLEPWWYISRADRGRDLRRANCPWDGVEAWKRAPPEGAAGQHCGRGQGQALHRTARDSGDFRK